MDPGLVGGPEFADALRTDEAAERFADPGGGMVAVDADELPDALDSTSMERFLTLPAVVAAVASDPCRRPGWADLVVDAPGARLAEVGAAVGSNPQACTVLAVLLRGGGSRSTAEGLVAESTAYGLLQAGPEFDRWRAGRPRRHDRPEQGPAVLVERRDGELLVSLNRPHVRNALDSAMRDELDAALHIAVADPSIGVVHLRGAGPSFCSGGDLDEFGSRSGPPAAHLIRLFRSPARTLAEVADRTVAHLHGDAVGSGIELAAFAHRVVADRATRIALPEVRLGLVPGAGGTVSLPRRIGRHRTMLLALTVEPLDAATALEWGLVDELTG
ncbi:MAG: enoyl-CoA hydratase/isomerase family protein [Acidimicrobiales bacterium]